MEKVDKSILYNNNNNHDHRFNRGYSNTHILKKFEEYAYIIDYSQRSKSSIVRGKEGIIIQALGEEHLTLLELLGLNNMKFDIGERVYIGKDGRKKIASVLGKIEYHKLTQSSKNELPNVIEKVIEVMEKKFVEFINTAQPVTPRIHALELIPGIGKTYMMAIIKGRETKPFESFVDIHNRTGLRDISKLLSKRVLEEISGEARINIFIRK